MWHTRICSLFFYLCFYKENAGLCFCLRFCRDDRYVTSVFTTYFELYSSIYQGVKSVVAAHPDVLTRMELCTSLTNDDVACLANFTTEFLNA